MKLLKLNIPDFINLDNKELKVILASKLYELGKLSLGQAADVAELTNQNFMSALGKYDVSIFNYPVSELEKDIKNS